MTDALPRASWTPTPTLWVRQDCPDQPPWPWRPPAGPHWGPRLSLVPWPRSLGLVVGRAG